MKKSEEEVYDLFADKVPPEYLRLAAWLNLLLGEKEEINNLILTKLKEVENYYAPPSERDFSSFLKLLLGDYEGFSKGRPNFSIIKEKDLVPYVTENKNHGRTIVYPRAMFQKRVRDCFGENTEKRFYSWIRENKLVVIDNRGRLEALACGVKSKKRCYTFILKELENIIFF